MIQWEKLGFSVAGTFVIHAGSSSGTILQSTSIEVIAAERSEAMVPLMRGNYMGIYNVVTSLLGGDVTKEEMQSVLDHINECV